MRAWMLTFCGGVIIASRVPQLPAPTVLLLLCLLAALLAWWPRSRLAAALLAGACWLLGWGQVALNDWFPVDDIVADVLVQGRVNSVPTRTERGWRLQLEIDNWCEAGTADACSPLAWHERRTVLVSIYEDLVLQPGQRWQWLLRLRRPHGFANPGGFDYEAWLLQQGIAATGYVRASPANRLLAPATGRPWFHRLRHDLAGQLEPRAGQVLLHAGLIKALALGLHQDIHDEHWRQFTQLGLNHLVVISGLHIALVAGVLYRLGLGLACCSPALLLGVTAPRFAAACALAGAWFYAGLAGFSLPVLRSLVMAAVFFSGTLLQRQTSATASLLLALLLVLLVDPLAPQSAGFWLSFVAVAILLRQRETGSNSRGRQLLQALRLQCVLSIGMLPVMLVFFQQGSVLAPLVNLPAIPYVGLLVVPLCLLGLALQPWWPAAGTLLLRLADFLLDCFMRAVAGIVQQWPGSLVSLPPLSLPLLLGFVAVALCILLGPAPRWRLGGLAALPLLLLWPSRQLEPGELTLTVLDVGQGLAVLVRTRQQQLLYDSGPRYSARFDAGEDVLLPALRRLGVDRLDTVIISHADADHAGGLAAIMQSFPDARYLGSELSIFDQSVQAAACRPQVWHSDGFTFELLHPDAGRYSDNDGSCVLHISGSGGSILLPGDISRGIERQLLQNHPGLRADILIAPHHGSKTSSSAAFIRALQPQMVIFSAGYLNRFGHPALEIRERYAAAGVPALATASAGAVLVQLRRESGAMHAEGFRALQRRFWHRPAESALR
jgi:competence protein ComEC